MFVLTDGPCTAFLIFSNSLPLSLAVCSLSLLFAMEVPRSDAPLKTGIQRRAARPLFREITNSTPHFAGARLLKATPTDRPSTKISPFTLPERKGPALPDGIYFDAVSVRAAGTRMCVCLTSTRGILRAPLVSHA